MVAEALSALVSTAEPVKSPKAFYTICTADPLDAILEAHARYLTPAHLRKGKGGRQRATDPRRDPRMDPKKARRILANRLSAARSKMRQKDVVHVSS